MKTLSRACLRGIITLVLSLMLVLPLCGAASAAVYTIKPGDSIWKISQKFGTTVSKLKQANGLKVELIYPGQKMYIPETGVQASTSRGYGQVSSSEFDTLARIITAEADNQSYQTQVAVGAVVLNRVKSPMFPNTIRGVVYQVDQGGRYQFEPVLNGWINRPASETAKKAARDVLNGVDPTGGALFFWESWVQNKYLNARALAVKMGAFTFTY